MVHRAGGVEVPGYNAQSDVFRVESRRTDFREGFRGNALDATRWTSSIGTGGALAVASSNLTLSSGTTAGAITQVVSTATFTLPLRVSFGLALSQRIANQTFLVELVSIDPGTLLPDEKWVASLAFDGTSATQAIYRVIEYGEAPVDSSAVTFPSTASGGRYEIEARSDEVWFHGSTLDATTGRLNSYCRQSATLDPDQLYRLRLRWVNGVSPPASSSNAVLSFVGARDFSEVVTEPGVGRGSGGRQTVDTGLQQGGGAITSTTTRVTLATDGPGVAALSSIAGLSIPAHDYISLGYTGSNLTSVVYKSGGAGGTTVATLTLGYTGSNLTSVTKS